MSAISPCGARAESGRSKATPGSSLQALTSSSPPSGALWGGAILLVAITVMIATRGTPNVILYVAGFAFLGLGVVRQVQSRNARRHSEP